MQELLSGHAARGGHPTGSSQVLLNNKYFGGQQKCCTVMRDENSKATNGINKLLLIG
jgi:hypothetical protein